MRSLGSNERWHWEKSPKESISVDPEEVNTKVNDILADLDDKSIDRDRLQSVVSEDLLKEKIVNWLLEHSTVELVPEGTLVKEPESTAEDELATEDELAPEATGTATDTTIDVEAAVVTPSEATEDGIAPQTEGTLDSSATSMEATTAKDESEGAAEEAIDSEKSTKKSSTRKKTTKSKSSASDEE